MNRTTNTPQTAYGAALCVIKKELQTKASEIRVNKLLTEMTQKYTTDEIIRVADAISRFGLDALCDNI